MSYRWIVTCLVLVSGAITLTSVNAVDSDLPVIASFTPAMNADGVPANASIILTFSKDMDTSTFNPEYMKAINTRDDDEFEGNISYDEVSRTLSFTPTGRFFAHGVWREPRTPGFHYGATIEFTILRNVTDMDGNNLDGQKLGRPSDFLLTFTVEADPGPQIINFTPRMDAENVESDVQITVVFSRDMDVTTLIPLNIKATNTLNNIEFDGELSYESSTRTLTFTPTGRYYESGDLKKSDAPGFQYGTGIQFTITSNVTDMRGIRLDGQGVGEPSDFIMAFTVEDKPSRSEHSTPFPQVSLIILAILGGGCIITSRQLR